MTASSVPNLNMETAHFGKASQIWLKGDDSHEVFFCTYSYIGISLNCHGNTFFGLFYVRLILISTRKVYSLNVVKIRNHNAGQISFLD